MVLVDKLSNGKNKKRKKNPAIWDLAKWKFQLDP